MSWRTRLVCFVCLMAACACAAHAITDSEAIEAVRDFESSPSLEVVLSGPESQLEYGLAGATRATRGAGAVLPNEVTAVYKLTQAGSVVVRLACYYDDRPGSACSLEEAQTVADQYAAAHHYGYSTQSWTVESEEDSEIGDHRVSYWRLLPNGVKTLLGGCQIWVSPSTGRVTAYRFYAGEAAQSASQPPAVTAEQATTAAISAFSALEGLQPTASELQVTEDGVLAWCLSFPVDETLDDTVYWPAEVWVDAQSGTIVSSSNLAGSAGPASGAALAVGAWAQRPDLIYICLAGLLVVGLLALLFRRRKSRS